MSFLNHGPYALVGNELIHRYFLPGASDVDIASPWLLCARAEVRTTSEGVILVRTGKRRYVHRLYMSLELGFIYQCVRGRHDDGQVQLLLSSNRRTARKMPKR